MVPDYLEPIVAYRHWSVHPNGLLTGLAAAQPWRPKQALHAVCNGGAHTSHRRVAAHLAEDGTWLESPVKDCICGVHAMKAMPDFEGQRWSEQCDVLALGEVYIWGRIVEHEAGYRAEFAYPKSMTVYGSQDAADKVASLYGVPVARKDAPKLSDEYGWMSLSSWPVQSSSTVYYSSYGIAQQPSQPISSVQSQMQYLKAIKEQFEADAKERERERQKATRRGWKKYGATFWQP